MRTSLLAAVLAFGLVLAAPIAAASGTPLESLLERLGVLPPTPDPSHDPVPDDVDVENPSAPTNRLLGDLTATVEQVVQPAVILGKTLSFLGLNLVDGMFGSFQSGGRLVASSMNTVATNGAASVVIASISLALVGAASALGGLVQRYGSLGSVPLYTRISKSALLENEIRQQIFELIKQEPGINVSEISRRLNIAWGTATHHLQKLRHELLVSIRLASNQKCYFPNGGSFTPHEMDVMSAVKHPTAREITQFLIRSGPRCHRDITQALGLTPALVSFHASKLVRQGVLARERQGRNTMFMSLESSVDPVPRPMTH